MVTGNKHAGIETRGVLFLSFKQLLDGSDVFRFQAFFALLNIEADQLSLVQRLESTALNGTEMNKNITSALLLDEAETFTLVEPLYFTF
jgi:hypothetical protein